jgi:hypothetical protein
MLEKTALAILLVVALCGRFLWRQMESDAMRAIPVIRCTDVKRSLAFYTGILGF